MRQRGREKKPSSVSCEKAEALVFVFENVEFLYTRDVFSHATYNVKENTMQLIKKQKK